MVTTEICPCCKENFMYVGKMDSNLIDWLLGCHKHGLECLEKAKKQSADVYFETLDWLSYLEDQGMDIAMATAMSLLMEMRKVEVYSNG